MDHLDEDTLSALAAPISTPTNPDGPDARALSGGRQLHKGTSLGRYVLLEKLGSGGMGEVFAAYDPQLDRKVALNATELATQAREAMPKERQPEVSKWLLTHVMPDAGTR